MTRSVLHALNRMPRLRRGLLALPLAAVAVLLTATPALAHTSLEKSTPAAGAVLATPPTQVSLTFAEAVTLPANPIRIVGADGTAWTVGAATVKGSTVTAPVSAAGPAGAYTMSWTVFADDGDAVKGTVPFTLSTPATPPTTPAAAPTTTAPPSTTVAAAATTVANPVPVAQDAPRDGGGVPGWVWVLVAVVVVLAALGVVLARARRSRRT